MHDNDGLHDHDVRWPADDLARWREHDDHNRWVDHDGRCHDHDPRNDNDCL